jgi:uncharacterized protein (DUF885 family)
MRTSLLLLSLLMTALAAGPDPLGAATSVRDPALRGLLEDHWAWTMARYPTWATELGAREHDGELFDPSPAAWDRGLEAQAGLLARALALDPEAMSAGDGQIVRLLRLRLEDELAEAVCRDPEWAVSPRGNPLVQFNELPESQPLVAAAAAEALLARYRAIPGAVDASITNLRRGLASGRVATAETVRRTVEQVRAALAAPVAEQPLLTLKGTDELVFATTRRATPIVRGAILPALTRYADFLEAEVLPQARPAGQEGLLPLSLELPAAPAFVRHGGSTAFVEGWALYSERLADELGLYSGDIDRLGMLSFDAWRASRLVVDTGIHAFGWSRQQAIDFLTAGTPLAANNIDNEVDRYINTPGQALAYKVGQLEILALRRQAEAALGASFELRAFHDVVLGGGAMPLPMLRQRVEAWIAARR